MFRQFSHSSILCLLTEALLSLLRPLNFVHHGRYYPSCRCECSAKNGRTELATHDDVAAAMRALGMSSRGGNGGRCLLEEAEKFLEDKTASFRELNEAFRVFDRDGDGFISAGELQSVMTRLGLESSECEDYEKMIQVFDRDGDGRISFDEFQAMMHGAE